MLPRREVVITGMGIVSPIGIGREAFWQALVNGRSGVRPFQSIDASGFGVRFGAEILDFDPKAHVRPRKSLKVMSREIQLGFAAADMALADAGFEPAQVSPERLGVVFGADPIYSELEEWVPVYRRSMVDSRFVYDQWAPSVMSEMYPLWLLKYLPNMTPCHVAIAHDARGPNNSIVMAEASGLLAIAEATRIVERSQADMMIAGASSAMRIHPTSLIFHAEALLSRRNDDPAGASRPFDADRDGMVNGEGAAAFIVESRRHAERRGARILARIAADASRFEARPVGAPITGLAIRRAIEAALSAVRMKPLDIGHVNAAGLSTSEHDRAEARAICDVLGNVPVTAPTSYFGHLGAAAGAVELAASLVAMEHGQIPPTLNYERPDADCPINVVFRSPRPSEKPTALAINQTLSGQAVALVLVDPRPS
ncbi:MAG TPA: beta-ketoacyl-[acyl-carrier-protein] synthase family protein [Pirellulales bacterium]|nr:beta-ketoacyl-[acyl-carrier-protein] synthase family protein [Pirellulales bacterium]